MTRILQNKVQYINEIDFITFRKSFALCEPTQNIVLRKSTG